MTIQEFIDNTQAYFEKITGEKCKDVVSELRAYDFDTITFFADCTAVCSLAGESYRMAALIMYAGVVSARLQITKNMTKH